MGDEGLVPLLENVDPEIGMRKKECVELKQRDAFAQVPSPGMLSQCTA
jgi:hypothetical protein